MPMPHKLNFKSPSNTCSNRIFDEPFFVRQSASWLQLSIHRISSTSLVDNISRMIHMSIFNLLSESVLVEYALSTRDALSVIDIIGSVFSFRFNTSFNIVFIRKHSSKLSTSASVSALNVLLTTRLIFFDSQLIGMYLLFSPSMKII